jgi:hypothetical protein
MAGAPQRYRCFERTIHALIGCGNLGDEQATVARGDRVMSFGTRADTNERLQLLAIW